jgi:hypothetical protein
LGGDEAQGQLVRAFCKSMPCRYGSTAGRLSHGPFMLSVAAGIQPTTSCAVFPTLRSNIAQLSLLPTTAA